MKGMSVCSVAVDQRSLIPPRTLSKTAWDTLQNCPADGGASQGYLSTNSSLVEVILRMLNL